MRLVILFLVMAARSPESDTAAAGALEIARQQPTSGRTQRARESARAALDTSRLD